MRTALTIAGSDSSGGAGIQADLKTFMVHDVYGMSVITALTAQNTCGVQKVMDIPAEMVGAQLEAVFTDIFPDAVKIGMTSSADIIGIVAEKLQFYKPKNLVVDPVMVSTSGHKLLSDNAMEALTHLLLPLADLITPNIPEAECLCGFEITTKEQMARAAGLLSKRYRGGILLKGGHLAGSRDDLLYQGGKETWFEGVQVDTSNTHGTGCTLSSAIAANLAKGADMATAVGNGKRFIQAALSTGLNLGKGNGPVDHGCLLRQ